MADSYSEPALFKGMSSEDCEIFVAMIRRRALEQGKQRDREWMAIFASSYLIGDALYWYESLDEDVQNDWTRLRPALLARFGRSGPPRSATSSAPVFSACAPDMAIPTPAAAPPPAADPRSIVRMGRLKVLNFDGGLRGYLAQPGDTGGLCFTLSTSPDDALLVSFNPSKFGEVFEIQITEDPKDRKTIDCLAVCWQNLTKGAWLGDDSYMATSCWFSKISSRKHWDIEKKIWAISKDGELSVEYPKQGGGTEKLQPSSCQSLEGLRFYWLRPSRPIMGPHDRVRIVVEDVM